MQTSAVGTTIGSVVRLTEAYISYLMFSINETPVILRMVNDHPYENAHILN